MTNRYLSNGGSSSYQNVNSNLTNMAVIWRIYVVSSITQWKHIYREWIKGVLVPTCSVDFSWQGDEWTAGVKESSASSVLWYLRRVRLAWHRWLPCAGVVQQSGACQSISVLSPGQPALLWHMRR